MKHIYTNLLFLALLPLAACSNDDSSSPLSPIKEKTYTDSSGLELYYNGNKMPGKTVVFAQDGDKAVVKAYSTFDLSRISGFGLTGELPSPGIIPGSPETSLQVSLRDTGQYWEFTGTGEDTYCTYSYEGYASEDKLKLFISDAKLKSGGVTPSAWMPAPIEKNTDGSFKSLPVYADWQYEPIPGVDFNFSPLLSAIAVAPIIPVYNNTAYMSISEAIHESLKAISFLPDGNILFTYISSVGGAYHIAQTYPNGYQYVISGPGSIKLYVNPLSFFSFILQSTSGSTPESEVDLNADGLWQAGNNDNVTSGNNSGMIAIKDILTSPVGKKILKNLMPQFLPMVAEGIPLTYTVSENELSDISHDSLKIYIDTEMAVNILTAVITPILEDSSMMEALKLYISTDPTFAPLLPDLEKAISMLPQAIERTTTFNLGLSLIPYPTSE
ncbi:MAG: hypothetical protein K2I44_01760 [Muribaculaceae bacterium]|nr:hypothetical protein [Muribaculaceae bacterium]